MASRNSKQAILTTVIYSSIFDFPLTKDELWQFLITKKEISKTEFEQTLKNTPQISQVNKFICLKGKEKTVYQRQKQKNEINKKREIAKRAANYLSYIPSIKFIGISGSLAVGSAKKEDDIDFFIITQKGAIWTTRLLTLALLEALNLRRKKGEKTAPDKICCNLLIEETRLTWPSERQNIYTAHEIAQLKPIFERNNMYLQFLSANQWIKKYLPNSMQNDQSVHTIRQGREYYTLQAIQYIVNSSVIKKAIEMLQKNYMKKPQTKEIIKKNFLAFHPHDYAIDTIRLFNAELKKYGLLTNI